MGTLRSRRLMLGIAAPLGALVVAAIITSLVLVASGHNPGTAFSAMGSAFSRTGIIVAAVNQAGIYYLSAVAVAVGFKMNLFNIGVDGQYRLAAMLAAAFAGATFMSSLPGFLRIIMTLIVAMLVGGIWSGIAGWLKVTRGVSEVITTIMLNSISTAIIAYLIQPSKLGVLSGQNVGTAKITDGGQVPVIDVPMSGESMGTAPLFTMTLLAVVIGILYWVLLSRTVFGFSLKATGSNPTAAQASGISVKKLVFITMLMSGAVAGLTGMPELLNGAAAQYSLNFPAGIGFTGIAIALLGRNHPVGIAFAALLWACLDGSSNSLQGADIPKELVTIMQGVIVFSVVIAYEIVRRYRIVLEQRDVARSLQVAAGQEVTA